MKTTDSVLMLQVPSSMMISCHAIGRMVIPDFGADHPDEIVLTEIVRVVEVPKREGGTDIAFERWPMTKLSTTLRFRTNSLVTIRAVQAALPEDADLLAAYSQTVKQIRQKDSGLVAP